jgi:very-short-patch-repair endonuclease
VPSNREQFIALEEALNRPVSKVTGPPGTGKSQVAVNLIANLVFNGLSVLFTSKNHKAVHAIYERADEASRVDVADLEILPLVQFCTTPQGEAGATWWQQRLDMERERFAALKERTGFICMPQFVQNFADTLDNWHDWKKEMANVDATRALTQDVEARLEAARTGLPVPEDGVTAEYADRLRCLAEKIGIFTDDRTIWRKLLDILLFRKRRALNAEQELRLLLPTISREAKSSETLRKRVVRLCCAIHDFLAVREEASQLGGKQRDLPEDTKKRLAENVAFRKEHLKRLFLYRRIMAADAVPDELVQTLKNALSRAGAPDVLPFLSLVLNEDGATDADWAQGKFAVFSKFFPAWATTLLSLSKASPCIAGAFDRVVIDEASQCEIPPIIPALFRAKGVTVIGDPKQFPPVITLREARHDYVRHIKHKLNELADDAFDFTRYSSFDVVSASPLLLREHFRCHADIADYFNEEYYGGKLKVRTNPAHLKFPSNMGFVRALVWREISDSLEGEIAEVKELFRELSSNNYGGEVGVISPFRKVVDRLKQELCDCNLERFNVAKDVNTANGFQGGERDLIVFVLGYTSKLGRGEDWYAVADANRYIYNVSVSRARACLIVVGDRERARQSSSSALRKMANIISHRPVKTLSQSPGEERLFQALLQAGLAPVQQYPLAGRYLDMALVDDKIDIEVDGEAWHLNKMGERKRDDIYRDLQVQSCGWRVCRFWYCEVKDNLEDCVAKVKLMVDGKRGH